MNLLYNLNDGIKITCLFSIVTIGRLFCMNRPVFTTIVHIYYHLTLAYLTG